MSVAEKLLEELRKRRDLREALALELIPVLFENRQLRLTTLTSLYRDMATKEDIKELRNHIENEINGLRNDVESEINDLREDVMNEINSLRNDVESEINDLRNDVESEINDLRNRVSLLEQRVARIEGQLNLFIKLFIVFNLPILLGIIGILLKMIFT